MSELEGRWATLSSGRLVRIIGVDGAAVIAETPGGRTIDRPLTHVRASWTLLNDDHLLVRAAVSPEILRQQVETEPVGVVVDAIRDLGGEAETPQIQALLERSVCQWVGTGPAFKSWWRRVQEHLGEDPRVDDSRSLERRYRLLAPGEKKRDMLRDRVSEDSRMGRRLAFAPLLKSAREHARRRNLAPEDRPELKREADLAALPELDPTDRFMAAELATWLDAYSPAEAVALLDADLFDLDLLRIPQKESRATALAWLDRWLGEQDEDWVWAGDGAPATLASSLAVGLDWEGGVSGLAQRSGVSRAAVIERAIWWSCPGTEESRPWKLPSDYEPYLKRLSRFEAHLGTAPAEELAGVEHGSLAALANLADSPKHRSKTDEVVSALARLATGARFRLPLASRAPAAQIAGLEPRRFEALMQVTVGGDGAWARTYLQAAELAFARDPDRYAGVVRLIGTLIGEDPGAIGLRVVRRIVRRDHVAAIALAGANIAVDPVVRADCVSLAGTADPENPGVVAELGSIAETAADALIEGEVGTTGTLVFNASSWRMFAARMYGRLEEAADHERRAQAEAAAAQKSVAEAAAAAEQSRTALAVSRSSTESQRRLSSARVAANVLKPIAAALADSIEAPSLEALQDRLAAALDRAHIEPILAPGDVQPFDPTRHRWVGEGDPSDLVTAISPGFLAQLEGEDAIVLVPARVVAAPST